MVNDQPGAPKWCSSQADRFRRVIATYPTAAGCKTLALRQASESLSPPVLGLNQASWRWAFLRVETKPVGTVKNTVLGERAKNSSLEKRTWAPYMTMVSHGR